MSGWWLIRLRNAFVFPDPAPILILCMEDQEFVANFDHFFMSSCFCFLLISSELNHFGTVLLYYYI